MFLAWKILRWRNYLWTREDYDYGTTTATPSIIVEGESPYVEKKTFSFATIVSFTCDLENYLSIKLGFCLNFELEFTKYQK